MEFKRAWQGKKGTHRSCLETLKARGAKRPKQRHKEGVSRVRRVKVNQDHVVAGHPGTRAGCAHLYRPLGEFTHYIIHQPLIATRYLILVILKATNL